MRFLVVDLLLDMIKASPQSFGRKVLFCGDFQLHSRYKISEPSSNYLTKKFD